MEMDQKGFAVSAVRATPIDYPAMIASLLAAQAVSTTAVAQTHYVVAQSVESCPELAIVTLLQGRPGWRAAASVLGGSFHPGIAKLVNANVL